MKKILVALYHWFFPFKIKTLDQLLNAVKRDEIISITITPVILCSTDFDDLILLGDMSSIYDYTLEVAVVTRDNRRFEYKESMFKRFGNSIPFSIDTEQQRSEIQIYQLGKIYKEEILAMGAAVEVSILDKDDKPLTDEMIESMVQQAKQVGALSA